MGWYEKNKERALAYQREYAANNRDQYLEYQKKYYDEVLRPKRVIVWEANKQKRMIEREMKAKEKQVKQTETKEKPFDTALPEKFRQPKKPRKVKYEPEFIRTYGEYTLTFN